MVARTKEEFIPTYELTLWDRTMTGQPTRKQSHYIASSGSRIAACYARHRKRNPLPKNDRRAGEDSRV